MTLQQHLSMMVLVMLASPVVTALDLDGRLDWAQRVTLGTLVSGVVEQVPVKIGARVAKGELLLALDGRAFKARIAESRANLSQAEVRLAEAQREDGRSAELYDRTLISDHERELARIELAEAKAAMQIARTRLQQARLDHEYSRIQAPFEGWVLAVNAVPGQVVVTNLESPALVTVVRAGQMQASTQLTDAQLAGVSADSGFRVAVGDESYPAQLDNIGLEPVRQVEGNVYYAYYALRVLFDVPNDRLLRAGQPVVVCIEKIAGPVGRCPKAMTAEKSAEKPVP